MKRDGRVADERGDERGWRSGFGKGDVGPRWSVKDDVDWPLPRHRLLFGSGYMHGRRRISLWCRKPRTIREFHAIYADEDDNEKFQHYAFPVEEANSSREANFVDWRTLGWQAWKSLCKLCSLSRRRSVHGHWPGLSRLHPHPVPPQYVRPTNTKRHNVLDLGVGAARRRSRRRFVLGNRHGRV